ncbi:histidinol-phosphate aminotransferase family protein, partial [Streptomyces sp. ME02-6978.2a]|nr:histidinol-phosphate aminotransferase family protein [Streptomyces sp. ME02-6978.2a]
APAAVPGPPQAPAPLPGPAPVGAPLVAQGWGPGTGLPGMPAQPGVPGLQSLPGNAVPPVETRRGMPAAGGLTAAQVRGRTQPDPPPDAAAAWPVAGAMYQAG